MKKIIAMCTALLLFVTGVCCKNNNENMSKMDNNDKTEKILFINGSPQVNGNTAALVKTLLEGFNYETLMLTERQWRNICEKEISSRW